MEAAILAAIAMASLSLLVTGGRTLALERRMLRRIGQTTARPRLPDIAHWLMGGSDRAEVERDLQAAGFTHPGTPTAFAVFRIAGALAAGLIAALVLMAFDLWAGRTRLLAIAATGTAYVGAKLVLRALASARSRRVNEQLPFALDLMTMMLESGISLDQSFRTLAGPDGNAAPTVRQAMAALVEDSQRGLPYDQALRRWADRLGVPGAQELAGLLRQSLAHGTELGGTLREFAREFTARRVSAARESIGRKTTSMALVMMVFLMPALFIMLCGPAVSTLAAALAGVKK